MNKPQNDLNGQNGAYLMRNLCCESLPCEPALKRIVLSIFLQSCVFQGLVFGEPSQETLRILYILSNPLGNLAFLEAHGAA